MSIIWAIKLYAQKFINNNLMSIDQIERNKAKMN